MLNCRRDEAEAELDSRTFFLDNFLRTTAVLQQRKLEASCPTNSTVITRNLESLPFGLFDIKAETMDYGMQSAQASTEDGERRQTTSDRLTTSYGFLFDEIYDPRWHKGERLGCHPADGRQYAVNQVRWVVIEVCLAWSSST